MAIVMIFTINDILIYIMLAVMNYEITEIYGEIRELEKFIKQCEDRKN